MAGFQAVSAAHPALLGAMVLCLTGTGRAVITAVRPIDPTGTIQVLNYATRPSPVVSGGELLGTDYGTLRAHAFPASRTVDEACGSADSGQGYELGLELSVPPGTDAGTSGWDIDYQIAGASGTITFPQGVVLCSTASLRTGACGKLAQKFGAG
jgi:hypothetical protein